MAILAKLAEKMKAKKSTELAVYAALAALGVLLFLLTSGGGGKEGVAAVGSGAAAPLEARLEATLSAIEGAGEVRVMLTYEDEEAALVRGAVVVAEGARDISVRMRLEEAVSAALGIEVRRVGIFAMDEKITEVEE